MYKVTARISLFLFAVFATSASAQSTLEFPVGEFVAYSLDSKTQGNPTRSDTVAYQASVMVQDAAWVRLYFGLIELEAGSYIRMMSALDGEVQELDASGFAMWNNTSAYFNGDTVLIELVTAPGTTNNRFVIHEVAVHIVEGGTRGPCAEDDCGICGSDDRTPSNQLWSGRITPVGCSGSVYSVNSCLVSAGHCSDGGWDNIIQFNVPDSDPNCSSNNPPVADQFPITDRIFLNGGVGNDWSVMTTGANNLGETIFERYGEFRSLSETLGQAGQSAQVWGYGADNNDPTLSATQQATDGSIVVRFNDRYAYDGDVTYGNSGSGLLRNDEIIGIITHCSFNCSNTATRIDRPALQDAIATLCPSQPFNDDCSDAMSVENGSYYGTTSSATNDGSASCGDSSSTPDVWYVYTADANGTLTVDTCGSSLDSVLSIHNFCPGTSANEIACEDDTCGQQSEVSIPVTVGTAYVIRVSGWNGSVGDFMLNVNGPVDNDPPEPNPSTWVAEPYAVTESNIAMSVTPSSDAGSPPVMYYFEFVDVQIPGGHDSGWQTSNFYADGDLVTNYLYGYTGRARDGQGNETVPAPLRTAATFIETPQLAPVVLTEDTIASLATTESFTNLTLGQSGLYFDSLTSGGDGGINEWVQMTSATAFGLTPDTDYTFRFTARNQDAVETGWSPTQTRRTKAAVPSAPVLSNATCASMDVTIGDDINPSYTTYAIHCASTSPTDANWEGLYADASGNPTGSAVYQTQADWGTTTLLNMAELTTYGFEVIARNASGITTAPGPEASLTTESCGSGETCDDGILNQGEDRIDCGGPCPPCSCLSDGACDNGLYCDGVETCDAWGECQPGSSADCDDGIACTVDSCNETTDQCNNLPDDALCDNGLFCDGAEWCDLASGCQPGTSVDCDDSIACTVDSCNEATDQCDNLPDDASCDNGLFCDGAEWCDPAVGCQDGTDPCGPEETCNEEQDVCESLPFCATLPDPAVCKGDVNGNGVVDPSDVGLVKFWYGDTDPASLCSYDVNCDGTIDTSDVGLVKFYYGTCGPESEAPCWME